MINRKFATMALVVTTVTLLAGCAGRTTAGELSDITGAESSQTTTPGTTATSGSTEEIADNYSLRTDLLDDTTLAEFREKGYVVSDSSLGEKIREEGAEFPENSQKPFLDYGGVVCRWGVADGDRSVIFAYGTITDEQAEVEKAKIVEWGATPVGDTTDRYTHPEGFPGGYAFGDGYWAYTLDNGVKNVLDTVIAEAQAF